MPIGRFGESRLSGIGRKSGEPQLVPGGGEHFARQKRIRAPLLLASAWALAPAALAREALVAYRASEECVAADKVLARALRGESSFTDAERRVAADVFLGTATRLRRYEWICAQRGLCGAASDATAVAAALLRARDEDDGAYTWPADADERLSAMSGAPLWLSARWRRDLGEAVAAAVAGQSTRRGPVTLRVRDDVSIGAVEEALAAAGVVTERPPAGVGNGGKSLALAARAKELARATELWCHDVDVGRLARLRARARRAGVVVRCSDGESIPDAAFDLVLVDAPCSGSGVLRRLGRTVTPAAAPPAAAALKFVNGPNVSNSTAISNSDNWTGAPARQAETEPAADDSFKQKMLQTSGAFDTDCDRWLHNTHAPDEAALRGEALQKLTWLEEALRQHGGPFFLGAEPSIVDAAFVGFLTNYKFFKGLDVHEDVAFEQRIYPLRRAVAEPCMQLHPTRLGVGEPSDWRAALPSLPLRAALASLTPGEEAG
ncbi:hypothetical protein EMIHUDRAFT_235513 [Emiliania huxleyi CCMP1516]|uniref:SAM-dependent methyltransferase RsmB-F/NOP2-type catalytic core domain-containing protein n=2 Tax=Emiliania huxleyi TaxID=2903 RepID=A0A0D3JVU9_EMIH1|nr:hypothetical protein EMIHUDRAFT_235513 [Emiliania huxleyi CCMP1516]EOD27634.1 hypothetical protein EMIHUDRAFT_235513 [Emiliania huxleyi CCMP1516]|eukprot:XP_005780063.1 hypothetical protein EMIHUDRAFT_235513 [Emiliania huxleyi CCMP1516]